MTRTRDLVGHLAGPTLGGAALRAVSVVALVAVTAHDGVAGAGRFGISTVIGSVGGIALSLGAAAYVTQQVATQAMTTSEAAALFRSRLLLLPGLVTIGAACTAAATRAGSAAVGGALVAASVVVDSCSDVSWSIGRALGRTGREAVASAATAGAALAAIGGYGVLRHGVPLTVAGGIVLAAASARLAAASTAGRDGSHRLPSHPVRTLAVARAHLGRSWPHAAAELLGLAYLRGDVLVLGGILTTVEVGRYVAAWAFVGPLVQLGALAAAGLVGYAGRGTGRRDTAQAAPWLMAAAGLLLAAALTAAGPVAARVLFPADHLEIAPLLAVLGVFVALRFATFGMTSVAVARGMALGRVALVLVGAIADLGLVVVLAPRFGPVGAAWAAVLAEPFVAIAVVLLTGDRLLGRAWFTSAAACGVAVAGGRLLGPTPGSALPLAALVLAAAAVAALRQARAAMPVVPGGVLVEVAA